MERKQSSRAAAVVLAVVAALLVARCFCAATAELLPEEAYYWMYSQHPALGYYDHPPMVAWVIRAGTALLGNSELGVRFVTLWLSLGASWLVFLTTRIWFDRATAWWATLLFNIAPVFVGTGLLAFPDGPLIFFWLLTLFAVSRALAPRVRMDGSMEEWKDGKRITGYASPHRPDPAGVTRYWMLAGVGLGGAMLSKYYGVLLAPSLLLYLLLSPEHRGWLRRWQPWVALAIALAAFTPVIVWNSQHQWASFLFQSTRTAGRQRHLLRDLSTFWLYQVGVLTPLMFALFAAAAARGVRRGWVRRNDRWNFAASFSLPLFAVFTWASFHTDVHVNWTAPAFLSLCPAAAALLREGATGPEDRVARRWRWAAGAVVVTCLLSVAVALSILGWGRPRRFASRHMGGWRELGREVEAAAEMLRQRSGQPPFVLGDDRYNLASELGFYTRWTDDCVNTLALGSHGLGFRYWTDLRRLEGRPAVAVLKKTSPAALDELRAHFDVVGPPRASTQVTSGGHHRTVYLVDCVGYHCR